MQTRPLLPADSEQARAILLRRPFANCYLLALLERRSLGQLIGIFEDDELLAVASLGGNCVASELDADSALALADHLVRAGRHSASIVCRKPDLELLWQALDGRWGWPRDRRLAQPLMVLRQPPLVEPDPLVRRGTAADFELLFPACVEMFTAEVGVSPLEGGMERAYRARISDAITSKRSFVRIDDGAMVFKTEVGAIASTACQLQGVWVRPQLRGQGLAAPAVAAVASMAMRDTAPAVELYVNDFNTPARKAYERVGFEYVDTFATVFF
ncbi:MAG: GNAT family N-acetyltransferase [Candidatus Nanopelagicales bacterium]